MNSTPATSSQLLPAAGGRLLPVEPDPKAELRSEVLGVRLPTFDEQLHIGWDGGSATV